MSARIRTGAGLLGLFALLGALAGCEDDLPKATEIVHMRVIGAKLEVVGDETRATPKPGERVRVTLPTVFPSLQRDDQGNFVSAQTKQRRVRALIVSCTAPDRFTGGIPICQELIDVATGVIETPEDVPVVNGEFECTDARSMRFGVLSLNCTDGTPVVEINVPSDYSRDQLLFSGIVCESGNARAVTSAQEPFGCADEGAEAIRVHGLIPIQQDDADENHNPDIGGLHIEREISGEWNTVPPDLLNSANEAACKTVSQGLEDPSVLPLLYGHIDFNLIYEADKREQFEGEPEKLEITVYTTAGEMERRFTVFEPDEPVEKGVMRSTVRYTPPKKDIPAGGQIARFYATARDQRGGFSVAEYALCLGQLVLPNDD